MCSVSCKLIDEIEFRLKEQVAKMHLSSEAEEAYELSKLKDEMAQFLVDLLIKGRKNA